MSVIFILSLVKKSIQISNGNISSIDNFNQFIKLHTTSLSCMLFKDSCIYINLSDKIEVVNLC